MTRATDKLRKRMAENDEVIKDKIEQVRDLGQESIQIGKAFGNIAETLKDIDKEFSNATGIFNMKDQAFLFTAIGLLCGKWLIMGQYKPLELDFTYEKQEMLTDAEGQKMADKKRAEDDDYGKLIDDKDKSEDKDRTVTQIIFRSVPYDAQTTINGGNLRNAKFKPNGVLNSKNHRAYTLGHDEVLGWIFGTVGIMTRSMTLKFLTLDTYDITEEGIRIKEPCEPFYIFKKCKQAVKMTFKDYKCLGAAVFKQGLHFISDKFTKTGLPLTHISAEEYLLRLNDGWDAVAHANAVERFNKIAKTVAKDTETVIMQFMLSFLINEIIKAVHLFLYDEETDGDIRLYQVRTRKILLTANCISSASNLLYTAGIAAVTKNPLEAAKRLDIGGFIETVHRLVADSKFISEIKREYVKEKLYERIYDSDFNWLYSEEEVW